MKKLIFTISFLMFISGIRMDTYKIDYTDYKNFVKRGHSKNLFVKSGETYQRVFKDGIWWIYVYDEDGSLVNIYPDV